MLPASTGDIVVAATSFNVDLTEEQALKLSSSLSFCFPSNDIVINNMNESRECTAPSLLVDWVRAWVDIQAMGHKQAFSNNMTRKRSKACHVDEKVMLLCGTLFDQGCESEACCILLPHISQGKIFNHEPTSVLNFINILIHGHKILQQYSGISTSLNSFLVDSLKNLSCLKPYPKDLKEFARNLVVPHAIVFDYLRVSFSLNEAVTEVSEVVKAKGNNCKWVSKVDDIEILWSGTNWFLHLSGCHKVARQEIKGLLKSWVIPRLGCLQSIGEWKSLYEGLSNVKVTLATESEWACDAVASFRNISASLALPWQKGILSSDASQAGLPPSNMETLPSAIVSVASVASNVCSDASSMRCSGLLRLEMTEMLMEFVPLAAFWSTLPFMSWEPVLRVLENPESFELSDMQFLLEKCLWSWANRNKEYDLCEQFYKSAVSSLDKYQGRDSVPDVSVWQSWYRLYGCIETPRLYTKKERLMLMIACCWPVYFWDNIDQKNSDATLRIRGMALLHPRFAQFMRQRMIDFGFINDADFPTFLSDYSTVTICSNVCRNGLTKWDWRDKFVFDSSGDPIFLCLQGCSKEFNANGIYAATTSTCDGMKVYAYVSQEMGSRITKTHNFKFRELLLTHPTVILVELSSPTVLHFVKFAFALNLKECIIKRDVSGHYHQFFSISHRTEEFIYQPVEAPVLTVITDSEFNLQDSGSSTIKFDFGVHVEAQAVSLDEVLNGRKYGTLTDQAGHFDGNIEPCPWHVSKEIKIGDRTLQMFGVGPQAKKPGSYLSASLDICKVSSSCMHGVFHDTMIGIKVGHRWVYLRISDGCGFMFSYWFEHFGIGTDLWHWRPHTYHHSSDIRHLPVSTPEGFFVVCAAAKLLKNCNDLLTSGGFERLILESLITVKNTSNTALPVNFADMRQAVVETAIKDVYAMVYPRNGAAASSYAAITASSSKEAAAIGASQDNLLHHSRETAPVLSTTVDSAQRARTPDFSSVPSDDAGTALVAEFGHFEVPVAEQQQQQQQQQHGADDDDIQLAIILSLGETGSGAHVAEFGDCEVPVAEQQQQQQQASVLNAAMFSATDLKTKEAAGAAQFNLLQQNRETAPVLSTTVDSVQLGIPSASRSNAQSPPSHLPFVQLPNISQSCWLNASLQCLLHTTELSLLFLDAKFDASSLQEADVKLRISNWPEIAKIFKQIVISSNSGATVDHVLLQQLKTEVDQIIDARDTAGNPGDPINPGRQKDSFEGLGVLVEAICPLLFRLRFISTIVCHGCFQESHRADPTTFLSLPFVQPSRKGKCVSLDECIKSYFSPEDLRAKNQYECSSCLSRTARKMQDASKQLFLDNTELFDSALPNVFFVSLNRYETSLDGSINRRINRKIDVPLEYDFGQHCIIKGTQPFRLYAVVCHRPSHYYAYCQPKSDMQWTNLDDQKSITNFDYSAIRDDIRSNGYIFFFSRTPAALNAAGAAIVITSDNIDIGDDGKGESMAAAEAAAEAKDAAQALLETQLCLSEIDRQSLVGEFICAHSTSFILAVALQQIVHRARNSWYHQDLMGQIQRIHDDMREQVAADDYMKEIMFEAEEKNVYDVGELIFAVIRDCDTCKKTTIATATPGKAAASPANPMLVFPVDELVFKAPRHFCFKFRDLQTRASQLVSKQNEAVGKSSISSALKQYNDRVYDIKHIPCYVYPEAYSSVDVRSNSSSSLSPCIAHPDEFINGGTVKWFFTALATLFPGAMLLSPGLFTYNCDQSIGQKNSLANWKGKFIKRRPQAVLHPVNLPKNTDRPLVSLGCGAGDPAYHWILFVFELGWLDHSLSNVTSYIMDPFNNSVKHSNARKWCNKVEAALGFSSSTVTLVRTPFNASFPQLQRGGNAHCAVFVMALGLNFLTKTLNRIEKHLVTDRYDTSLIGVELRKMVAWDCNHEPAMLNACLAMSPAFCDSNYLSQPPSASPWWRVMFTHDIVAALSLQPEFEKGGLFSLYGVKDGKLKENYRYDPDFPERFAKIPSDGPFFLQNKSFFVKVYCIGLLEMQDKDKRSCQRAASAFIDASATTLACESNGWWVAAFGLICIGLTTPCAFVCVGRNNLSTISKDTCCIELGDLFQNLAFKYSVLQGDYYCSNVVSDASGNKQAIDFERASMLKGKSPPRLFFQYYARSVASNNASSIQILMLQMRASGMEETQSHFSSIYRRNLFLEATFDAVAFSNSPATVFLFHGFWHLMELLYAEANRRSDPIPELAIIDSKMCISCHIRPFSWNHVDVVVPCTIFFEHLKDNSITISSAIFYHKENDTLAILQAAFTKRRQHFNFKGDEDASKIFKFALSMESVYSSTGSEGSDDAGSSPPSAPRASPSVKRRRVEKCRSERDVALDRQFNFLATKGTTTNVWSNCKLSVLTRFPDYELRRPVQRLLESSRPNNQLEPSHFGTKVFTVSGSDVKAQSSCIDFISSQNVLCIDTETVYPRFPEQNHGISLLQIGTSAQVFLIQVERVGGAFLSSLNSALGGKNKTLVHWGGSDKVAVLKVLGDIPLVNWTDLQYEMSPNQHLGISLGLDACMEMHMNGVYTVSKEWTCSGWDLVDLDLCQRDYAALDVVSCYVLYLHHSLGSCFLYVTEDDLSPSEWKYHSFMTLAGSAVVRDGLSFDYDRCCHYELGTLVQGFFLTKKSSGNGSNVVLPQGFKKTSWAESASSNMVDVFLDMLNSQKFCCRICFNLKWFHKIDFVCPQFRIRPGDLSQFSFQRGKAPPITTRVTIPVRSSESTNDEREAFFCLSMLGVFLKIDLRSPIDYACLVDSVRSDCRHGFICSSLSFFQE